MIKAIRNFFQYEYLLKAMNYIHIALILKTYSPSFVHHDDPLAL